MKSFLQDYWHMLRLIFINRLTACGMLSAFIMLYGMSTAKDSPMTTLSSTPLAWIGPAFGIAAVTNCFYVLSDLIPSLIKQLTENVRNYQAGRLL